MQCFQPEPWVHKDDPCDVNYSNRESLASHVLPTISPRTKITELQLDAVVTMCRSLYQADGMSNATFYEHLMQLNHWDGLRLATAQMLISSSRANGYLAGGDILRMANNIIKFQNLLTSPSVPAAQRENTHLLTIAMENYMARPGKVFGDLINFVLGRNDTIVSQDLRADAAQARANKQAKPPRKPSGHVTQGKHKDRELLRLALREDSVLGPILTEVEILVNKSIDKNQELVYP